MAEQWTSSHLDDNLLSQNPDSRSTQELLRRAADRLSERDQRIATLEQELRTFQDRLQEKNLQCDHLKATVAGLKLAEKQLQSAFQEKSSELNTLRSAQSLIDNEHQALLKAQKSELEAVCSLAHEKQTQLKVTEAQLHQLQIKVKERDQMVSEANLTLQAADTQIGILEQKTQMMDGEYRSRLNSLQMKLEESEKALREIQNQNYSMTASKSVMESEMGSLKSSYSRLLSEFKLAASGMSERWASAQVQFFKDTDQAISRLHSRIQTAIKCQIRLAQLLQKSVQKCNCLVTKLDRRNQRLEALKLALRLDINERDKVQKAYESGLLQIENLNKDLLAARKKTTELEAVQAQLRRRFTRAMSDASHANQENGKLRSALNIAQEKIELATSYNHELKCEIEVQRNIVERYLAEDRSKAVVFPGESQHIHEQHQSQLHNPNRSFKISPSLDTFCSTSTATDRSVSPQWYQELLTKMNGLISKVDRSIQQASHSTSVNDFLGGS